MGKFNFKVHITRGKDMEMGFAFIGMGITLRELSFRVSLKAMASCFILTITYFAKEYLKMGN